MENDVQSVIIDIPKSREYGNTGKQVLKVVHINRILKRSMAKRYRRPASELSLKKYILPSDTPLTCEHFKREELLVPFKVYTKHEAQDKHKQKLSIEYNEKYKVIQTDLKKRLHVEYPPDDIKALTDIDKGRYNNVNGRTIPDHAPVFKSLKHALADILRIKAEIGIRNDAILNMELNYRKELEMFDTSVNRFTGQAKYLDTFIAEDYRKSMKYLGKWEEFKIKLHIKLVELQNVATQQFTIMSRLMGLDYLYSKQQKYGRFLYYLSPPTWRAKNRDFAHSMEIAEKGFDLGYSSEEETFNVIFDKMKIEYLGKIVKPVFYFTQPHDLIDIFDGIEKQQLHHFAYVTHWAPRKKMLKEGIVFLKEKIDQESAVVENIIQGLQTLLKLSEERCVELKTKFFSILNGLFYDSVGAPEVLKLFVHLEFCYEKVYVETPINIDIVTMAKALEKIYMDYSKRFDEIHSSTINKAITQYEEAERRKMRRARLAARELRIFDRLQRDLIRTYEPVFHASGSQSFLPPIKGVKPRKHIKRQYSKSINLQVDAQNNLNESEKEYLSLFTDWTEGDDPAKYLHRLEDEREG